MWPACPSTDKVPDIAAEPVNGKGVAVTPDNPEPSPVKEPVKEPVISEAATVEVLTKVPTEMLGVCTKPAATVAKEAEEASSAFVACEEVPVRAPTKEPVKEPVIFEEATVPAFLKLRPVIVPSLELMWELAVIWPLGPWKHAAPDTVKSSPCVSAKLSVVPIVSPILP